MYKLLFAIILLTVSFSVYGDDDVCRAKGESVDFYFYKQDEYPGNIELTNEDGVVESYVIVRNRVTIDTDENYIALRQDLFNESIKNCTTEGSEE